MTPQTLLMTRPRIASERFVMRLSPKARDRLTCVYAPLMEIVPTGGTPGLEGADGVIFTSASGVEHAPKGQDRDAFCVGARTAESAQKRGWQVRHTALDADSFVSEVSAQFTPAHLVHLAGRHRRGEIDARLNAAGWQVKVATIYDQKLEPLSDEARSLLAGEDPVLLPLFSPRTARHLASQLNGALHTEVIALSPAVAAPLDTQIFAQVHVLQEPTGRQMVATIENMAEGISLS